MIEGCGGEVNVRTGVGKRSIVIEAVEVQALVLSVAVTVKVAVEAEAIWNW